MTKAERVAQRIVGCVSVSDQPEKYVNRVAAILSAEYPEWVKVSEPLSAYSAPLREEIERLKRILIESVEAVGGYAKEGVSVEFLALLPTEVKALIKRMQETTVAIHKADCEKLEAAERELAEARRDVAYWKRDALTLVTLLKAKCSDEEWKKIDAQFSERDSQSGGQG